MTVTGAGGCAAFLAVSGRKMRCPDLSTIVRFTSSFETPIPEPGALLLIGLGLGALAFARRPGV